MGMASANAAGRRETVTDASILINFLGLGRLDLLTGLPTRRILITPEVHRQIVRHRGALDAALAGGQIEVVSPLLDQRDAEHFVQLARRLGAADASCIVAARVLHADLAADDITFLRLAAQVRTEGRRLGTEALLAEAVQADLITLQEGDALLAQLPALKYRPKVASLRELLVRNGSEQT